MNFKGYWDFNSSDPCLCVGGYYYQSTYHGLFYVFRSGVSNSYANIGCRLMEI